MHDRRSAYDIIPKKQRDIEGLGLLSVESGENPAVKAFDAWPDVGIDRFRTWSVDVGSG